MGLTKRQFVQQAFEEIGLASYVFDLTPDELHSAVVRLDSLMSSWYAMNIQVSYPMIDDPDFATLDQKTDVPQAANEAIILNLALVLAPSYGKTVSQDTKGNAKKAYSNLLSFLVDAPICPYPSNTPMGSGNKFPLNTYYPSTIEYKNAFFEKKYF